MRTWLQLHIWQLALSGFALALLVAGFVALQSEPTEADAGMPAEQQTYWSWVGSLNQGIEKLLRAGRMQGDVSRRHALEDQVALVLGALQNLFFEWTHRKDFPIAERSARMARLLADALAPLPDEAAKRR